MKRKRSSFDEKSTDASLLRELERELFAFVEQCVRRYERDPDKAEDLRQAALLRIVRTRALWPNDQLRPALVWVIVRRAYVDLLRKEQRLLEVPLENGEEYLVAPNFLSPFESLAAREELHLLQEYAAQLSGSAMGKAVEELLRTAQAEEWENEDEKKPLTGQERQQRLRARAGLAKARSGQSTRRGNKKK